MCLFSDSSLITGEAQQSPKVDSLSQSYTQCQLGNTFPLTLIAGDRAKYKAPHNDNDDSRANLHSVPSASCDRHDYADQKLVKIALLDLD